MDLADIRAFLAVAEELHFGRAAARLHIAQPPLSRTIKRLERQLGAALFDRNTRSVQLTASGAALIGPAREVVDALRRAEAAVRSAVDGEVGEVRIAFAGLSTHLLVAEVARAVRSGHPGVHLELSSQNFAQPAMKRVVTGDTDVALGRWDIVPAEVTTEVVMNDSLVVALPDTHRLAALPHISIAQLAEDGFVSLPLHEGAIMPDRLRRISQANGFVANIIQVAPDTQTALALVSAEVGCHLTLASVARNVREPHVSFVPLADEAPDVDLRAAWRRDDSNPALRAVLDAMFALRA
ncbi:LysR substrate-binding domain-containing protein [Gordonia sp. CPCC 205333]|uniref:LysR substrate-binding domain-containing protein n=1 Tax=Gordonia sp. CPCC 205333 TaxID=3140790 RepID=UPI003AF3E945